MRQPPLNSMIKQSIYKNKGMNMKGGALVVKSNDPQSDLLKLEAVYNLEKANEQSKFDSNVPETVGGGKRKTRKKAKKPRRKIKRKRKSRKKPRKKSRKKPRKKPRKSRKRQKTSKKRRMNKLRFSKMVPLKF